MIDLVKKAQKGNKDAFLTLFRKYEQDLYRMAFVYVKNQNDALDVVQEKAYRSFKTIRKLKEPKYFKTWLIRISINCSIDLLRKNKKVVQFDAGYEEYIADDEIEDVELEVDLQDLMENLNEMEKSVVLLRFYESLTFQEISDVLNIPLGTAKTVLYRALNKLRQRLKGDDTVEKSNQRRAK